MSKLAIFTGGGTAGHVTPNFPIIESLQNDKWRVEYIGKNESIEHRLVRDINIPFHAIKSGKLRRYFSFENFIDPFKVLIGIFQSIFILRRKKPNIVFSKGGFVAFPVVFAAWLSRIPVIIHESDMSPGLANRLSFPFATKVCVTFEQTKKFFKNTNKIVLTGTPIRSSLFNGTRAQGLNSLGFDEKPGLMVIGGSLGSKTINEAVRMILPVLLEQFNIIHICGPGKVDSNFVNIKGYAQIDYAKENLPHLFAASDMVISRSGANSLYELLALHKPHILIPLPLSMSRGDQLENAKVFASLGTSMMIEEASLSGDVLLQMLNTLWSNKNQYIDEMKKLNVQSATDKIVALIKECVHDN